MKLRSDNEYIAVQPEIAEVMMQHKFGRHYLLWNILQLMDKHIGKSSGRINKLKAIDNLVGLTQLSRPTVARYVRDGMDIFWRPGKSNNILYLSSLKTICVYFDVKTLYSQDVLYNLQTVLNHIQDVGMLLVVAISSKTSHPISNVNLAERCGVCERTIINYLKQAEQYGLLKNIETYEKIATKSTKKEIEVIKNKLSDKYGINIKSLKIFKDDNDYVLLKQMPNIHISLLGRTSAKLRNKKIKKQLGFIPAATKDKRYYENGSTITDGYEAIGLFSIHENQIGERGAMNAQLYVRRGISYDI
jgi:transposase